MHIHVNMYVYIYKYIYIYISTCIYIYDVYSKYTNGWGKSHPKKALDEAGLDLHQLVHGREARDRTPSRRLSRKNQKLKITFSE